MADRTVAYMPLDALQPALRNPKQHADADIDAAFERFGYVDAVLLDERTQRLVGGHGRVERLRAARERGAAPPEGITVGTDGGWLVPVQRGWSSKDEAEAQAAGIALNRLAEKGGWDPEELYEVLDEVLATPPALIGVGFTQQELDDVVESMTERLLEFGSTQSYGGSGTHAENDVHQRAERYAGKGSRAFVLDYALTDFETVAADCARLRRALGCETNAALVKVLVEEAVAQIPGAVT